MENGMATNEDEIREIVERARLLDAQQKSARQDALQAASDRADRRQETVSAFRERIDAKFKSVAEASAGAMAYSGQTMSKDGGAEYELSWEQPLPARGSASK